MSEVIKGYKVFNPDWTCRDKQYACPGVFEEDGELKICEHGMHFCTNLVDCFCYYSEATPDFHIAEVESFGDVVKKSGINDLVIDSKVCTNKLKIIKEISWNDAMKITNIGKQNDGHGNIGSYNIGNFNTGHENGGDYNTGKKNTGSYNTGHFNSGDSNTGNFNLGKLNTGDRNGGAANTGSDNIGNCNTGYHNIGDYNVGDYNKGNHNIGSHNKCNFSTGCFNTIDDYKIRMFNKESDWTLKKWKYSKQNYILSDLMSEILYRNTQDAWDRLSDEDKQCIKELPNFDAEIFKECTGIDVNGAKI